MRTHSRAAGESAPKPGVDRAKLLDEAGPTISVPEYAQIFNIRRETAYALAARGELGVRVLRLGRSIRIPTADVRTLLGIDQLPHQAVPQPHQPDGQRQRRDGARGGDDRPVPHPRVALPGIDAGKSKGAVPA